MDELERKIYTQQCNALACGDLELYEVLKEAEQVLNNIKEGVKVIIDCGVVYDILVPNGISCPAEVIYVDPDHDDYDEKQKRRDEVCADERFVSAERID